jgi:SAM-dependent methyltransferase
MKKFFMLVLVPLVLTAQSSSEFIHYSDARPVFDALRDDLLPPEFRGLTPAQREAGWPEWVMRRDAAIRARVAEGDEDSVINLLQFGTAFTRQPRITEQQLAGVVMRKAGSPDVFVPSPVLKARIEDFMGAIASTGASAVASPGTNERLQFARRVIERRGINPATDEGRGRLRRYLEERTAVVGSAVHAPTLHDPSTGLADQLTIFRDRGLASDTLLWINFAIDKTLAEMKAAGALRPRSVRRAAIIGPGLDVADKQEGYDFYPQQTIQPFALIDSLGRAGLASAAGVGITAFDLSPAVLAHLEAARARAAMGTAYTVVLPRNLDQPWTADLASFRDRFGDQIGKPVEAAAPPSNAGRVAVRGVMFPPAVVRAIIPRDLNIVLQRPGSESGASVTTPTPDSDSGQFDLVVATNILLYYDVFEQSLAAANIAAMLRPGGFLLSNDRIFELPGGPVASAGQTAAAYMNVPGGGPRGDQVYWYQKR